MPIKNSPEKARKTPRTPRDIAKGICTRIENRLLRFIAADAFAEPPPLEPDQKRPKSPLMTGDQVHAALGLLKKYKPDLRSIEHLGNSDHPVVHEIRRVIVDSPHATDAASVPTAADPE